MSSISKSKYDVTKCCYFVDLKTGCLLIGYFYLTQIIISSILVGISKSAIIAKIQANEKLHPALPLTIGMTCLVYFLFVLAFAFCIVLLIGLYKNKPGYVKTYLIFKIIFLVFYANLFIYTIFSGHTSSLMFLLRIAQLAVSVYFLLVIRSYHMNVMKQQTPHEIA